MKIQKLFFFIFLFISPSVFGQSFMNEWIDHSKTYYRFKVGAKGVYRISKSDLNALGIGNADAAHFQLWRRGEEVPVYTSSETGALTEDGYLEFWGQTNDGYWENRLYLRPEYQINPDYSLFSDTSVYFLTVNTQGNNKRLKQIANNVSASLTPEPYFMHKALLSFKNQYSQGFAAIVGTDVFSSSYDNGEGYVSTPVVPGTPFSQTIENLQVETTGPDALFRYTAAGRRLNIRNLSVSINNTTVDTREMNYFNSINDTGYLKIPLSLLSANTAKIDVLNLSAVSSDRMSMGMMELIYPRKFNFDNQSSFEFELAASATGNKLIIRSFNNEGVAPVLYDLTNGYRLSAPSGNNDEFVFVLPPSAVSRKLVLASVSPAKLNTITDFFTRKFVDYRDVVSGSDYIIISNPLIYSDEQGVNQVEDYAQYRSGAAGGSHQVLIADINQLIDQFGWGIKNNPLSIRNFLRFARNRFTGKDHYCLLIGKGVTPQAIRNRAGTNVESRKDIQLLNLVPTFGVPCSDIILATDEGGSVPKTHIGRLNVVHAREIKDYLDKVKLHEEKLSVITCNFNEQSWKKNILHVGGANDFLGEQIMYYLDRYKAVASDTLVGAKVYTVQKTSLANVQVIAGQTVSKLFTEGFSLMTYFGHSSASSLEFNLDNPENYPFSGKFPVFLVNGCAAGNLFTFDSLRLNGNFVLSEKYVVGVPQRGSIAFIASTHLGIVNYLNLYSEEFYNQFTNVSYGKTLGQIMSNISDTLISRYTANDFFVRHHVEQILLHGDPAVSINSFRKPDYAIENSNIIMKSDFVSISERNYSVKVLVNNLGRVNSDSVFIRIERIRPNNLKDTVFNRRVAYVPNVDSVEVSFELNPESAEKDKGLNKLIITIDPENLIDEECETNNVISKDYFVYEDEIKPVYPFDHSIVNKKDFTFYASTSDPLQKRKEYFFQIDTTTRFNSSFFAAQSISSTGGLLEFKPQGFSPKENIVYYWRVGFKEENSENINWNQHSFIFRSDLEVGFNQSHHYQFLGNQYRDIIYDSLSRRLSFKDINRKLKIKTGLFPSHDFDRNTVFLDLQMVDQWRCQFNTFSIYVFDGKTITPWKNSAEGGIGKYGSIIPCSDSVRYFFEYAMGSATDRNNARILLEDVVPDGNYILIINQGTGPGAPSWAGLNNSFIEQWMADTTAFGSGKSIYHAFKKNGLTQIDSFTRNLPFAFLFKKGNPNFVRQFIGAKPTELIDVVVELPTKLLMGTAESPWFGPMQKWNKFYWDGEYLDGKSIQDTTFFELIGKRKDGSERVFSGTFQGKESPISFIDAKEFPYLKIKMVTQDSVNLTPFDIKSWKLTGQHIPEGTVAPNISFICKDTVEYGQDLFFSIAFKNISPSAFDSLKLNLEVTNSNNNLVKIPLPRTRPLVYGDTVMVSANISTKSLTGANRIYLVVNPDNDQPEKYFFNNFIYKDIFVKSDNTASWIDVTFDGTHILNKDIVSSRPQISVKIKDENKFVPIMDMDSVTIKIRYPDGSEPNYRIGTDSVRIVTSDLQTGKNEILINLTPKLVQDGEYELLIDRRNKREVDLPIFSSHRVGFTVYNKPMISNVFNYPNPFTSSTAFVFTLTGYEIPQNLRIQIMTISGKVVKEITKNELGPLRIGRNITQYKWDGTDQYGNQLANGVYLYRVLTNLNGNKLDKFTDTKANTDQFFKNGYGKMYLMR